MTWCSPALAEHRRNAMWRVEERPEDGLFAIAAGDDRSPLSRMTMPERVQADYETMN